MCVGGGVDVIEGEGVVVSSVTCSKEKTKPNNKTKPTKSRASQEAVEQEGAGPGTTHPAIPEPLLGYSLLGEGERRRERESPISQDVFLTQTLRQQSGVSDHSPFSFFILY